MINDHYLLNVITYFSSSIFILFIYFFLVCGWSVSSLIDFIYQNVEGYNIHGDISIEMEMHNFMTGRDYASNSEVFISLKGDNRKHNNIIKTKHKPKFIGLKQYEIEIIGNPVKQTPYDT